MLMNRKTVRQMGIDNIDGCRNERRNITKTLAKQHSGDVFSPPHCISREHDFRRPSDLLVGRSTHLSKTLVHKGPSPPPPPRVWPRFSFAPNIWSNWMWRGEWAMRERDLTVVSRVISLRRRSRKIGNAVFNWSFDKRSPVMGQNKRKRERRRKHNWKAELGC